MDQEEGRGQGVPSGLIRLIIVFFAALTTGLGYLAAYEGPLASGVTVDLGLILYIIALLSYTKIRFVPLGLMLGADVGHIIYDIEVLDVKVTFYPFMEALASMTGHISYNFDVVQVIIIVEVIYAVYRVVNDRLKAVRERSDESELIRGQGIS
ncbi:MAG: hypothetical protein ACP5HK_00280 [Acidilobus sp.]